MATVTGTASNYLDLIGKLRDFLKTDTTLVGLGQQWTQLSGPTSGTPVVSDELVFRGPGLAGADQVLVGIRMISNTGIGSFNVGLQGMTAYNPAVPLASQTNSHSAAWMLLVNVPITYWFVANGRRFIVIARVGSTYEQAYAGFILPEHLPEDWRYPMFVGASSYLETLVNADNSLVHTAYWNGNASTSSPSISALSTGYLCDAAALFLPVANRGGGTTNFAHVLTEQYHLGLTLNNFRQSLTGQPILNRVALAVNNILAGKNFYGCFDGVFHVPALGVVAEQTVTISSVNYMIFPNVFRSDDGNMCAIALQ